LQRCEAVLERFRIHLPTETAGGLYLYARSGEGDDILIGSRIFSPNDGIAEDAATGSAAAMLGALLGRLEPGADDLTVTIDEGVEMRCR
jgi:trans-2,3-dihydro-3-hydroxyanthranilate isomerase